MKNTVYGGVKGPQPLEHETSAPRLYGNSALRQDDYGLSCSFGCGDICLSLRLTAMNDLGSLTLH